MSLQANMDPNPESQQQPTQVQQQQQQQSRTRAADEEDETILEPIGSGSVLFDRVHQMMEKFATTRIGQYVFERGDRVLRTIEDTVKWSLPQDKPAVPLVRPLPWIPFLVLIIFLRQLRIWLSLVALLIGNGPVTPQTLIYFIQTRRRKLRSIRINGMKAIQQEAADRKAMKPEYDNKILVNLCKIFTIARCRPRLGCQPAGIVFSADNPSNSELLRPLQPVRHKSKREREDDDPVKEFVAARLMAKFSTLPSDDDSEYLPVESGVVGDSNDESTVSGNNTSDTQGEYSMDTSGENAKDLSIDECEETDKYKSLNNNETTEKENAPNEENKKTTEKKKKSEAPGKKASAEIKEKPNEEKIIPTIEISCTDEKNSLPSKNMEHNDKEDEKVLPSSDTTITVSPKTPTLNNGQNKSGRNDDIREADAYKVKSQPPKSQKEHIFNILNGHNDEQKKATPGHESAADTIPPIPPSLLSGSSGKSNSSSGTVLVNASSPDFSTFYNPSNNQQKPTVSVEMQKASSVNSDNDDDNDDDDDNDSQHAKQQRAQLEQQRADHYQLQQQQSHYKPNHHQRYRRNRR